jgi:putative transposase
LRRIFRLRATGNFLHLRLESGPRTGAKAGDLARKHGISEATLYNWKAKYGGMEVSDAKRLKALDDENAKLKKLLADQMLEASALRELLSKNVWSAPSVQGVATSQ